MKNEKKTKVEYQADKERIQKNILQYVEACNGYLQEHKEDILKIESSNKLGDFWSQSEYLNQNFNSLTWFKNIIKEKGFVYDKENISFFQRADSVGDESIQEIKRLKEEIESLKTHKEEEKDFNSLLETQKNTEYTYKAYKINCSQENYYKFKALLDSSNLENKYLFSKFLSEVNKTIEDMSIFDKMKGRSYKDYHNTSFYIDEKIYNKFDELCKSYRLDKNFILSISMEDILNK